MAFSCPDCSFTTKYKCSLERHKETCKKGALPKVYSCDVCGCYATKNKTHFENHQTSRNCKKKSEEYSSLREEIDVIKKQLAAIKVTLRPFMSSPQNHPS
jgi:hypothetical protein